MIDSKKAPPVNTRDSVKFFHRVLDDANGTPKVRIAVVIRTVTLEEAIAHTELSEIPKMPSTTKALVIFATTKKYPDIEGEEVQCPSREARNLSLNAPSYFYARNIRLAEVSTLTKVGRCPPELFLRLAKLANDGLIQLAGPPPNQP